MSAKDHTNVKESLRRRDNESVHILLVEDNPADVKLIEQGLDRARVAFRLATVCDGEQAIRFLRNLDDKAVRPNLILLDWALPKMSGHEVLSTIKSDENLRQIPVVVLTSSSAPDDIEGAYNLYANCYLRKPLNADQFLDMIEALERFWLQTATLPRLRRYGL